MHATQPMAGTLTLTLHDSSGRVVERRRVHNLVTDSGRNLVAQLFAGHKLGAVQAFLVVGTGDAPPSPADRALADEVDAAAVTAQHVSVDGALVTLSERLIERDRLHALREAGIAVSVGGEPRVLYNRVVFDVVNKAPNMQMTLTWSIDFGGGK